MSGNFQDKLKQLETPPPAGVWDKIAETLDHEFSPSDSKLAKKLYDWEADPPPFLFNTILAAISPETRERKVVPIWRRASVAAVILGIAALTVFFLFRPGNSIEQQNAAGITIPGKPQPERPASVPEVPAPVPVIVEPTGPAIASTASFRKKNSPRLYYTNQPAVQYAGVNSIRPANSYSAITVDGPPITDRDGNIIMDETLVIHPDGNYIIVTSPNGEQTRISRKFFKMLSLMNGSSGKIYLTAENFEWKSRFDEWKAKLQQTNFIPTAGNFLDIMDFKELVEEKYNQ